jgi:septation ring formation regulator EzrA
MDDETRERFERIERNLDILTKIQLDYHREHEERIAALEKISGDMRNATEEMRTAAREMHETNRQFAFYTSELDKLLKNFVETFGHHDERLDDHERRLDNLEGGGH